LNLYEFIRNPTIHVSYGLRLVLKWTCVAPPRLTYTHVLPALSRFRFYFAIVNAIFLRIRLMSEAFRSRNALDVDAYLCSSNYFMGEPSQVYVSNLSRYSILHACGLNPEAPALPYIIMNPYDGSLSFQETDHPHYDRIDTCSCYGATQPYGSQKRRGSFDDEACKRRKFSSPSSTCLYFDKLRSRWVVRWWEGRVHRSKTFAVSKFGFEQARHLAEETKNEHSLHKEHQHVDYSNEPPDEGSNQRGFFEY